MQNPLQKFRQSFIVFEKTDKLAEKLLMRSEWCSTFVLFCLDLDLFAKIKKTWFLCPYRNQDYQ